MTHQFAISPDVHVRDLYGWFLLNTRIQRITGEGFRATIYDDFSELHRAYSSGAVDLVFANAADGALLVRDAGFSPIARPVDVADEAAVVVSDDSPLGVVEDVAGDLRVAATDAPDVERICRILLEPAGLDPQEIGLTVKRNYTLVAKAVLTGEVQAGFFLRRAYDDLSEVTRKGLRPLISSRIYVVTHSLLASPAIAYLSEAIAVGLEEMASNPADQELLADLGAAKGWQRMSSEEMEFMIDLMDTLAQ
jgi:phosphonate transport system substrate-binding protein